MELRHLRYFVTVAEELNITRAAVRLNLSQPPLSRQIRDLEEELGIQLLKRTPKQVQLTAAGRVFLKEARKVLHYAQEAVLKARAVVEAGDTAVRVAYAPTPTIELLPRALKAFRKLAPQTQVVLLDLATDEMITGLRAGKLDIALLVKPPLKARKGLAFHPLIEMPVGIIVPPGHAFAKRTAVALADALRQPLVGYIQKGYADYHHWLASVTKLTRQRPVFAAQVDGAPSLVAAVEAGQGIAFGPPTFTKIGAGRVKFVPLEACTPSIEVGYAVRQGANSEALAQFIKALKPRSTKPGD